MVHCAWSALPLADRDIDAPIVTSANSSVSFTYFQANPYKLSFTNRKWKYFEEQTTATLKIKQTSIATVGNHILTVVCFLTPLFFHYPLPLISLYMRKILVSLLSVYIMKLGMILLSAVCRAQVHNNHKNLF